MKMPAKICCTLFFVVVTTGISAELNPLFQDSVLRYGWANVPEGNLFTAWDCPRPHSEPMWID